MNQKSHQKQQTSQAGLRKIKKKTKTFLQIFFLHIQFYTERKYFTSSLSPLDELEGLLGLVGLEAGQLVEGQVPLRVLQGHVLQRGLGGGQLRVGVRAGPGAQLNNSITPTKKRQLLFLTIKEIKKYLLSGSKATSVSFLL